MIDEQKVSLMTKLAIFEKNEKRRGLVISKYFRSDYVRFNVLKTLVAATFVYWLVVAAYVFMNFEDLLAQVNDIDYFSLVYKLLGWYVGFCFFYFVFASFVYEWRYYKARKSLAVYNGNLKDLIELEGGGPKKSHVVLDSQITDSDLTRGTDMKKSTTAGVNLASSNGVNNQEMATQPREKRSVSKLDMIRAKEEEAAAIKQQEIIANVNQRNARLAEQEQKKREQEEDRQRILARRTQIEQEQMRKLREERARQMGNNRENHNYQGNEGGKQ